MNSSSIPVEKFKFFLTLNHYTFSNTLSADVKLHITFHYDY